MTRIERMKVKCGDTLKGFYTNAKLKVAFLLKCKEIDIKKRHFKGNTPLHYAAQSSAKKSIKFLLKKGADPNALNENGHTPLSLGLKRKFSNEDSLKLLLLAGANLLIVNANFGNTFFGFRTLKSSTDTWVAERLVAQLAIYDALGHSIEGFIKTIYDLNIPRLKRFYGKCRETLRQLKTQKIRNYTCNGNAFTMFTILSERPEKVARYIKDDDWPTIINFMKSYKLTSFNLYYLEALEQYTEDIVMFSRCRKNATQVVRQFTGLDDSHYLIVNKIVDCFNAQDFLMNFK